MVSPLSNKPASGERQIVWLAALALGAVLLGSMRTMEAKWMIAIVGTLLFWGIAILTGRVERFLLGFLFFCIPLNADFQIFKEVTVWHGINLPTGTPQMGISVIDLTLMALYPLWIGRLLAGRRRAVLWPGGASFAVGLIAWGALSMLNSPSLQLSFFLLFNYAKAFLLFFYVANNVRTREDFLLAARCLVAGMAVEGLIACAQQFAGGNLGLEALGERKVEKELEILADVRFRTGGTLGHPNALGGYLASVLPVALAMYLAPEGRDKGSFRTLIALGIGALALIFSLSRSAWLTAGLACIALLVWTAAQEKRRFRWQPVLGLLLLGGIAAIPFAPLISARWEEDDRGSTYSRIPQTQIAMEMIRNHPVIGVGLNNQGVTFHRYETYVVDPRTRGRVFEQKGRFHNMFLQMASEIGLVGFAWFAVFMASVVRLGWRRSRRCPDLQVRWVLMGVLFGLLARVLHDTVHTGEVAVTPQLWMYSGLLAASVWMLRAFPRIPGSQ